MRITAEAKSATRDRILHAAARLFKSDGWHDATTRDIAAALMAEALERSGEEFRVGRVEGDPLEADLFSLIWSGLLSLRKYRKFLAPACETIFSPLARQSGDSPGDNIRIGHLELVQSIVTSHGFPASLPAVTVQLYWTLYLGVLAFWAADDSPGQEDSLALLDQSLKLFVASLGVSQGRGNYGRQSE